jgi:nitrile hydratase accessory protein
LSRLEGKNCDDRNRDSILQCRDGRGFDEPWEAEALALSIALQEAGYFTATEWSAALGAMINQAQACDDVDDGASYYKHVLAALEQLVRDKSLIDPDALHERRRDWEDAYRNTPHGQPVKLAFSADETRQE